jgi:protein-L-isoaspartate(D-aspartate) O-methyltransferase
MGYTPKMFYGDGYKGLPKLAPFHKIIVTCGAPFIPDALVEQLKPGGMMVIPVGSTDHQKMLRLVKKEDGSCVVEDHGDFVFVPMLKDKEW